MGCTDNALSRRVRVSYGESAKGSRGLRRGAGSTVTRRATGDLVQVGGAIGEELLAKTASDGDV
jgi:hypothetical protein